MYFNREKILNVAGMKELYDKDNELEELRDRKKRMKEGRENLDIIRKREGKGVVPIGALD